MVCMGPVSLAGARGTRCQRGARYQERAMFVTSSFPDRQTLATLAARMLLETRAVHFDAETPFRFTSGWASPAYVDCRRLISFPRVRATLMDFAMATLLRGAAF